MDARQPTQVSEKALDGAQRVNKMVQLKRVHLKATQLVELMEATVMMSEGKI